MKNGKKGKTIIAIIIFVFIAILSIIFYFTYKGEKKKGEKISRPEQPPITAKATDTAIEGEKAYKKHCMSCHGEKGDGKGIFAKYLYPKPRDFTSGVFKLRSTPSGSVPTDEDLEGTIEKGMLGTGMPSFVYLPKEKIKAIIQYIKGFATKCIGSQCIKFFEARKSQPIELPEKIDKTDELLALGAKFYKEVQCGKCHGNSGKGDGPGVEELKDRWGYPVKPRDFTKGEYIGGNSETDLLKRFLAGMDGSPMPSFVDSIKEMAGNDKEKQKQLLWGLVYYVKSLEEKNIKIANTPRNNILYSTAVSDSFNFDIDAKEWETANTYEISLNRLWQIDSNYKIAYVKSVYNSSKIGFLVEWDDETPDYHNFKLGEFQDMVALQFSSEDEPPFLGMGSKESPTNIWLYKPDRKEKIVNSIQIYPNLANDLLVTVPNNIDIFYTSKVVGNLRMPNTIDSFVEDMNATGAQTITSQPQEEQDVTGIGRWSNGRWKVIFIKNLKTSYKWDIQFDKNKKIPIAFAIWDGSKKDRNGQKLISTWYYVIIK